MCGGGGGGGGGGIIFEAPIFIKKEVVPEYFGMLISGVHSCYAVVEISLTLSTCTWVAVVGSTSSAVLVLSFTSSMATQLLLLLLLFFL